MLLNTHTALRSFLELDYDLKEFLNRFKDLYPIEGETFEGDLVEFRWADGSVDLSPTFEFIKGTVDSCFPQVTLGDSAEFIPSTSEYGREYYRKWTTLFIEGLGLSVNVGDKLEASSKDLDFIGGRIEELIARYVTLDNSVKVSSIQPLEDEPDSLSIATEQLDVTRYSNISEANVTNTVVVTDTLDLSAVHPTCAITLSNQGIDISSIMGLPNYGKESVPDVCTISGNMRYHYMFNSAAQQVIDEKKPSVYVEVPSVYAEHSSISYEYNSTGNSQTLSSAKSPFDENSDIGLTLLYPKKCRLGDLNNLNDSNSIGIRLVAPDVFEKNRIVTVRNVTAESIRACNVWQFGSAVYRTEMSTAPIVQSTINATYSPVYALSGVSLPVEGNSSKYGVMTPLNYVDIPAYSTLDFLFTYDIVGTDQLVVYMLPMKNI